MKPWVNSLLSPSGKEPRIMPCACSVLPVPGKPGLAERHLSLKRDCVFFRPQEEEGETAGEAPQVHHAATERTSPVSFMSRLSSSWESLLPEPAHPF